jgi:exosortase A-associated hydrolase 2
VSSAFFIDLDGVERFCVYHPPAGGVARARGLVYLHPFGEEMNKARRMAALQSRRLAAAGCAVLQIDLYGCGDSGGDFRDARWALWKRDAQAALGWLKGRTPGPVGLWALRLGAMLAADVARDPTLGVEELVLWQPVANGEQFLTQFLRTQLAAEMLSGGAAQTRIQGLRAALSRGEILEVGGYELHPELASAIDGLRLAELKPSARRVHWLEVSAQAEAKVAPAAERTLAAWRASGLEIGSTAVPGEPFWSTLEIAECRTLLDATDESWKRARVPS